RCAFERGCYVFCAASGWESSLLNSLFGFLPTGGGPAEVPFQKARHGNPQMIGDPKEGGNLRLTVLIQKVLYRFNVYLCGIRKGTLITLGAVIDAGPNIRRESPPQRNWAVMRGRRK